MKIQTLLVIISGCLALIAIISLFGYSISASESKEKVMNIWKKIGLTAFYILVYLILMLKYGTGKQDNYNIFIEQQFSSEHHLPQLDSTMFLKSGSSKRTYYVSWSKDSILHYSKNIEYDITDVYSVSDIFINKKNSLTLESIFIKQNILRDSANIYILKKWFESQVNNADTISREDFDKLIADWGLADKINKRFEIY